MNNVLIFFLTLLVAIAYSLLLRDISSSIAVHFQIIDPSPKKGLENHIMLFVIAGVSPLCFFQKIHALRVFSGVAIISVTVLACAIGYHAVYANVGEDSR